MPCCLYRAQLTGVYRSLGSHATGGNFIAASAAFLAFNWEAAGSSLAVLPLNTRGRQEKAGLARIDCHSQVGAEFIS